MTQYWFKPHLYGYGASPTGWKGWAAIAAYVAAILALTLPLFAWPADLPDGPRAWQVATALGMAVLATFAFFHTARARTMDNGVGVGKR
jgi:hypothetical protein